MKKNIRGVIRKMGFDLVKRESEKQNVLHRYKVPKHDWEYKDGGIYLKEIGLQISEPHQIENLWYLYAKKIRQVLKGKFYISTDQQLKLEFNDLQFTINDPEELYIIYEVFIEQHYNINPGKEFCVIDIGQNVGITSLYFAGNPLVKKIYGFELFPETFRLGQVNIQSNKSLAPKITSHAFGLGKKEDHPELEYSLQAKGRMGMYHENADLTAPKTKVKVEIRDVDAEVRKVANEQPGVCIIGKIDCEGAEYEILERLFETGQIDVFSGFMIEWHYKDPAYLLALFNKHGFMVVKTTFEQQVSGMIYASKTKA